MSYEVTNWLTEIKALKEQLAELQSDRNAAWESAEKWRQLYSTEAQQRRTETKLSQQAIASLKAEIDQLRGLPEVPIHEDNSRDVQQEIAQLQSVDELKSRLVTVLSERERLLQALKSEQTNHSQTRKSLTTALGDAIDRLTRERTEPQSVGVGNTPPLKNTPN
jgi:chromosome segregation ATPase